MALLRTVGSCVKLLACFLIPCTQMLLSAAVLAEAEKQDLGSAVQVQGGRSDRRPCVCFVNSARVRPLHCSRTVGRGTGSTARVVHYCRGDESGPWVGCRPPQGNNNIACIPRTSTEIVSQFMSDYLEQLTTYLACVFAPCMKCPGGYSPLAACFAFRTKPRKKINFRSVEESPFLIGVKWQGFSKKLHGKTASLLVLICWSERSCDFQCAEDHVDTRAGVYMVPSNLLRFSVFIGVYTSRKLFSSFFDSKKIEPNPPCHVMVRPYGASSVKLTWKVFGHMYDGFQVSWCPWVGTCFAAVLPANQTFVVIGDVSPFRKFYYNVQTFRGNSSNVTYSEPVTAHWKARTNFEVAMYLKMLVEFLMAAVFAGGAAILLGFILVVRDQHADGANDGDVDASQRGDHRRVFRHRQPRPRRVCSRGDS
ncbi:uncharacterized protein LOC135383846 [Ornithodoros turicata]|uniref:uncharacterized protein LOC135383846 n=1 Tax=Ornithodoros turicata TaxID=34597 RepID=UPI0031397D14